jgi:hypothetical protein
MMRFNKITLITLLLCFATLGAQAQEKWNIGGKSNLASFNVNLGNPLDLFVGNYFFILNYGGELQYRRILNQKWEANVGIGFNRAKWEDTEDNYIIDLPYEAEYSDVSGSGSYSDMMWNVCFRYYRKSYGSFSPLGYYYKFGVMGTQGTVKTQTYLDYRNSSGAEDVSGEIPVSTLGLVLGYGREFALTDKLFFGFGGDIILSQTTIKIEEATGNAPTNEFYEAHTSSIPSFIGNKNIFMSHYSLSYLF